MAILSVGVGQQYGSIADAVSASQDGDVIQIQAGTYTDDFAEVTHKVTLEGVGGMAHLVATGNIPNGKAILITDTDITIDHLEFSGATVADQNGAGIRYQGGNLTITNSSFHDNQNGLLSADDPTGSITIEDSDFYGNGVGGAGYTHNLYVGDVGQLTIDSSYFHGAIIGHEIKSRAENDTITNTRIQDEPGGTASYEIDLPNGGNATITNDVIEQSANSNNSVIISYGEEGNVRAGSALTVSGNTILNDQPGNPAGVRNSTPVSATISNNAVYGLTSDQLLRGSGAVTDTTYLTDEPALVTTSAIGAGPITNPTPTPPPTPAPPTPAPPPVSDPPPVSNPTQGLVLDISEDAWQGDAQYSISVDGVQIGGSRMASASHAAGQTEAVAVDTTLSPGTHTVTVDFFNDFWDGSPSMDRNLYVDGALLDGTPIPGSALGLGAAGPQSFSVTAPTDAASNPPPVTSVPTPTPTGPGLVLDISEDAWQGDAQYTISVDGQQIGGVRTASASHAAGQTEAVSVDTTLAAGSHAVTVNFLNDFWDGSPSMDRNLYVDTALLDGKPIAGSALGLGAAGPQSFSVAVGNGTPTATNLVLDISEDAFEGDAQYTIAIDGQQIGDVRTASATHLFGQTEAVALTPSLTPGTHNVSLTFLNDAYASPTQDRNLYLDNATLNGAAVPGSTIGLWSQGTATFGIVVPTP